MDRATGISGWSTWVWGCGSLYILYRLVARASGSVDLPLGGCLVAEAVLVPLIMVVCDGFLLAWVLTELRKAGFDDAGEDRFHPAYALELMPAACLGSFVALPARYVGTLVFLVLRHLPTSIGATWVGRYIRWQFGWGLIDLQGASLVFLGMVGVVAWGRGSLREALGGFRRLLASQGGHLDGGHRDGRCRRVRPRGAGLLARLAASARRLGAPRRGQLRPLRDPPDRPVDPCRADRAGPAIAPRGRPGDGGGRGRGGPAATPNRPKAKPDRDEEGLARSSTRPGIAGVDA